LQQGIKEIAEIGKLIKGSVGKCIMKYFPIQQQTSFVQIYSGIEQVINVRVGSSEMGDNLSDGSSYPSIVGTVVNDYEDREQVQDYLFRYILEKSDLLVSESDNS